MLAALAGLGLVATLATLGQLQPRTLEQTVFGEIEPTDGVDFAPYVATARAILLHTSLPPAPTPTRRGRRAFVVLWSSGCASAVGTGIGETLLESVAAAAHAVKGETAPDARVELDIVSGFEPIPIAKEMTDSLPQLGLHGYVLAARGAHIGFVLPTEMLVFKYFDPRSFGTNLPLLARDRLFRTIEERAGLDAGALDKPSTEETRMYRITTKSYVESSPGVTSLVRSMPQRPSALTPKELVEAARAGADYLSDALDDDGRFRYYYRPVEDADTKAYGVLRHAGAAYALLEAYQELGNQRYLAKAESALRFLDTVYRRSSDGLFLTDALDEEQQKVGGSGLALLALAKHAELTGAKANLETMRGLAGFIAHQQYADGHFRNNADVTREEETAEGKQRKEELFYYPGEAILGLMRLYRIDRQPKLLAAAENGAQFLIVQRDGPADDAHQIHDHWLTYALFDLYRETRREAYAEHAFKIARAILKGESTGGAAPAPDFIGTFNRQGTTTPTSTRLEALAATLELSLYMRRDPAWLDGAAMRLASFMRGQQYDDVSSYFLKTPAKARGGLRESLFISDIRIDYVQHAVCAWLHLARALRDPGFADRSPNHDSGRVDD
jgi:hypothetical protein